MCTVVLSFLPYEAGKQQLDEEMPKIRHFHFINRYQGDNQRADKARKYRIFTPERTPFRGIFLPKSYSIVWQGRIYTYHVKPYQIETAPKWCLKP